MKTYAVIVLALLLSGCVDRYSRDIVNELTVKVSKLEIIVEQQKFEDKMMGNEIKALRERIDAMPKWKY